MCSQVERCVNTHRNYTCEPIVCPSLETVSNRTCVCVNDLVRNVTSGECVCPSDDQTYNATEEACVCIDPLAVFNTSLGSCVCDSTFTYSISEGKCICSDPLAVLNDTLRRCVCVTLQLCSLCWRTSVFVLTHWLYSTPLHIASGVECVLIHM